MARVDDYAEECRCLAALYIGFAKDVKRLDELGGIDPVAMDDVRARIRELEG